RIHPAAFSKCFALLWKFEHAQLNPGESHRSVKFEGASALTSHSSYHSTEVHRSWSLAPESL
ncbi:MAG TPA: hypothetical protein VFJ58_11270, partial [Armatimonadota bacterium]|nr:hypothetical protein [Armatimonadota bacterium]